MASEREALSTDKALGMGRPIERRDFLNGAAVTALGLAAARRAQAVPAAAPQDGPGYYPPLLTGMRGSHPGSFEVAHTLRDGTFWAHAATPQPVEGDYDLIIVGGGISGLAAARFYLQAKPGARILILENHDDVGGHAKRNEFPLAGRTELINGGTLEIDSPRPYSAVSDHVLKSLGIDPPALEERCAEPDFYRKHGMLDGIFFDRETFGADRLIAGVGPGKWAKLLADSPLSPQVQRDIVRIEEADIDYLPGKSSDEKKAILSRTSYKDFLLHIVKADPGVVPVYQSRTHDEWAVGIDAVSALDVWSFDYPGFQGLKLEPGAAPHMGNTAAGYAATGGSYKFHFPDGNATIVRSLVRDLVPGALQAKTPADVVTARFDYTRLDQPRNAVRIRLSSIVVGARNLGDATASHGVEVAYQRAGQLFKVHGKNCILASWNMMIPYICPDLPAAQKAALHYLVKNPLVYTSVAITNWRAFAKLGVNEIYSPGSYHSNTRLNPVTNIGAYSCPASPDAPMVVRMVRVPCTPGLDERTQHRLGHVNLLATSFETFERNIRDQLGRMLAPGGFDPARDITAITVNRWPHGYAYEYNPLFDPQWPPGQAPHEIGRTRFGRIAIANSDSGAAAYTDCAIDQAHRAVGEILALA
jgi:spermidine dehydrogenase